MFTSTMRTPGMMGLSGKCPGKKLSFIVTFFMATAETPGLYSITLSTSRKGNLKKRENGEGTNLRFREHVPLAKMSSYLPVGQNLTNLIDVHDGWECGIPCSSTHPENTVRLSKKKKKNSEEEIKRARKKNAYSIQWGYLVVEEH